MRSRVLRISKCGCHLSTRDEIGGDGDKRKEVAHPLHGVHTRERLRDVLRECGRLAPARGRSTTPAREDAPSHGAVAIPTKSIRPSVVTVKVCKKKKGNRGFPTVLIGRTNLCT